MRALTFLFAATCLAGCELIGLPSTDARVTVDPTVVRTVHPILFGGIADSIGQATDLRNDEIDCLHTTPRLCAVFERITVTVVNTGTRTIHWDSWCEHQPLQRRSSDRWDWILSRVCSAGSVGPVRIRPGERLRVDVHVERVGAGDYRVQLALTDGPDARAGLIDDDARTSPPFHLEPFVDVRPYACPTQDQAQLATRLAREHLQLAAEGKQKSEHYARMLQLENRVPGFAGAYLEGNGAVVVRLTDASQADAAVVAVREVFGGTPVVQPAAFSYSEMMGWHEAATQSGVRRIRGVYHLGIDEQRNAVVAGIFHESYRGDVECLMRGIGMPEGMGVIDSLPSE